MKHVIVVDDLFRFVEHRSSLTGIQRVIVQLITNLVQRHGAENVLLLSSRKGAELLLLDSSPFRSTRSLSARDICLTFGLKPFYDLYDDKSSSKPSGYTDKRARGYLTVDQYVARQTKNSRRSLRKIRLIAQNFLTRGNTFKRRGITAFDSPVIQKPERPLTQQGLKDLLKEHCVVFVPGTFWSPVTQRLYALKGDHNVNFKIAVVVYDLTPIRTPEYADTTMVINFEEWIRSDLTRVDLIFTISQYSRFDLENYARSNDIKLPTIKSIPLAHEFPFEPTTVADLPNNIRKLRHFPFVVSVGLLDGRKNNWSLLRVWGQLERELGVGTPLLVLVGSFDRPDDQLQEYLRGTHNLCGLVRIIESPTDEELAWLYSNCTFTVYPSFFEGWGLPVGESLWFRKAVITSNSSSLPEVGGASALYFELDDLNGLYCLCKKLITDRDFRTQIENNVDRSTLRTWDMVSRDFLDSLLELEIGMKS